jgi:hypothetical protein
VLARGRLRFARRQRRLVQLCPQGILGCNYRQSEEHAQRAPDGATYQYEPRQAARSGGLQNPVPLSAHVERQARRMARSLLRCSSARLPARPIATDESACATKPGCHRNAVLRERYARVTPSRNARVPFELVGARSERPRNICLDARRSDAHKWGADGMSGGTETRSCRAMLVAQPRGPRRFWSSRLLVDQHR